VDGGDRPSFRRPGGRDHRGVSLLSASGTWKKAEEERDQLQSELDFIDKGSEDKPESMLNGFLTSRGAQHCADLVQPKGAP
jgi:hypothetical protein